jgi:transposase-like protein
MMEERNFTVDHTTIYRGVQWYAPELDKRSRPQLRPTNDSYRVDETYVKIQGEWFYLYRALDSTGQTIDFMLSARRDTKAAKRFFRKMLKAPKHQSPRVINVGRNKATQPRQLTFGDNYQHFQRVAATGQCADIHRNRPISSKNCHKIVTSERIET